MFCVLLLPALRAVLMAVSVYVDGCLFLLHLKPASTLLHSLIVLMWMNLLHGKLNTCAQRMLDIALVCGHGFV